ncbi:hypothetical protein OF83DRAFT_1169719 [Amylostereum chailletii]|nr:hypothetical protein OF83DRAFT_1169719 [Amylostereum chailletii]
MFEHHWEEAKRRLGPEEAGTTLEDFIRMYTKVVPFPPGPWMDTDETRIRTTGSQDPMTYDQLVVATRLAPTTEPPCILYPTFGTLVKLDDDFSMHLKIGRWSYSVRQPNPGDGLELQGRERVVAYTARFTMPFGMEEVEAGAGGSS